MVALSRTYSLMKLIFQIIFYIESQCTQFCHSTTYAFLNSPQAVQDQTVGTAVHREKGVREAVLMNFLSDINKEKIGI